MADQGPAFRATPGDYAKAYDTLQFLLGAVEAEALSSVNARSPSDTIPLAIIAGFLGAGKTTLMRRLLTAHHGLRIAAVVNDFADLNIDSSLVSAVSDDTLALANGCICCSQSGGALRVLTSICERLVSPDLILLEASGIADPWALGQLSAMLPGIRLDCITTVVDGSAVSVDHAVDYLRDRQLSAADLVLLNKMDLVDFGDANIVMAEIARAAPRAGIIRTTDCAVPYQIVFDAMNGARAAVGDAGEGDFGDEKFLAHQFVAEQAVDRDALEQILDEMPAGILRAKGFVRLRDDADRPMVLQLVGRRWRWEAAPPQSEGPSRLVVIGLRHAFDEDTIASAFSRIGLMRV
jgi:G3E family GTPase